MCRRPFPLVDTFFSEAGALYLVLRNRAERLWISCLDYIQGKTLHALLRRLAKYLLTLY